MILNFKICLILFTLFVAPLARGQEESDDAFFSTLPGSARVQEIREKLKEWDQAVLGFRKEHQFAFTAGASNGHWHFKRFGSVTNKVYESSAIFAKFQYTFHLPIYSGFGYFLGSSAGYLSEKEVDSNVKPASANMFPGIIAGLALNITPGLRLSAGMDYYLERWNHLGESNGDGDDPRISVTARALDALLTMDVFFQLKWAVRFEAHRHEANYRPPKKAQGKDVDAVISKRDNWFGVGLLYHLF